MNSEYFSRPNSLKWRFRKYSTAFTSFAYRLSCQLEVLAKTPVTGKFGGATGNFNAHRAAYPGIDWIDFGNRFLSETLGIGREQSTHVAFGVLEIDGVYLVRHSRGANLAGDDALVEVAHRDILAASILCLPAPMASRHRPQQWVRNWKCSPT